MSKYDIGNIVYIADNKNRIYTIVDIRVVEFGEIQYKYLLSDKDGYGLWYDENVLSKIERDIDKPDKNFSVLRINKPNFTCPHCGEGKLLRGDRNSYYCESCNVWVEPLCDDLECPFCSTTNSKRQ